MERQVHPTAEIDPGVELGAGTHVWSHVHVRGPGTRLGAGCIVGERAYIAYGVTIGDLVKLNAGVYVCTGVTLGSGVLVGAGVIFTNDRYPRAATPDLRALRPSGPDERTRPTTVEDGATIGAGSVVGCDLTIGRFAMVGMGAVVTRSVAPFHLVVGQPARPVAVVSRAGEPLMRFSGRAPAGARRARLPDVGVALRRARRRRGGARPTVIRPGERVAVVGAGALGLRLAWHLTDAGVDVTLYEAGPELGGLASSWTVDTDDGPVTWDRFYHVVLESDRALRALLRDVGLDDALRWTTTQTGYAAAGRVSPVSTPRDFLRLPGLSLVAKARLAATLARGASVRDWRSLERLPVQDWLTRWSGRATFEQFWVPLLRAKLGDGWRDTNAAFVWATIRRLTAARRAGLGNERFGAVPGGVGRILTHVGAALASRGVDVRCDARVDRITATADGVEIEVRGERRQVDHVVLTTTPGRAATMVPGLDDATRDRWRALRYQGVVCVSLVMRRPLAPYYLTYLMDALPFTAVVEMTTLIPPAWLGGHTLVYLPRYVAAEDPLFACPDDDVVADFLAGLTRLHPVTAADVVGRASPARGRCSRCRCCATPSACRRWTPASPVSISSRPRRS